MVVPNPPTVKTNLSDRKPALYGGGKEPTRIMRTWRTWARCWVILALAGACGFLFNLAAPQGVGLLPEEVTQPLWERLELAQTQKLYQSGALFVDARDVDHYQRARVRGAVSLSPAEWDNLFPLLRTTISEAPAVVVYGHTRSRFQAAITAQRLKKEGIDLVLVINESMEELGQAGLPISEPRRRSH